jgi:hypothetical protein
LTVPVTVIDFPSLTGGKLFVGLNAYLSDFMAIHPWQSTRGNQDWYPPEVTKTG